MYYHVWTMVFITPLQIKGLSKPNSHWNQSNNRLSINSQTSKENRAAGPIIRNVAVNEFVAE